MFSPGAGCTGRQPAGVYRVSPAPGSDSSSHFNCYTRVRCALADCACALLAAEVPIVTNIDTEINE